MVTQNGNCLGGGPMVVNTRRRRNSESGGRVTIRRNTETNNGRPFNDDPGVCDTDEEQDSNQKNTFDYPDTGEFLNDFRSQMMNNNTDQGDQPREENRRLPMAGDYQGLGGPDSIPLEAPLGVPFIAPPRPAELTTFKERTLLDELYLSPSPEQIAAFERIRRKEFIAQNKYRFKLCVSVHFALFALLVLKVVPEILDRIDVFVLELEELYLPEAHLWEWLWLLSAPLSLIGVSACKKSNANAMTQFFYLNLSTGLLPVVFAMIFYAGELAEFISTKSVENIGQWRGYPLSVLWYVFLILAVQIHLFELHFARVLINAWVPKKRN